ncbi:MAG: pyrimidine/purine nucleoside phosphorylase [Arcobacteraceae bacterium]|nr:pyrimidine/purine nucleoside phosphorylase [Arcobacteraceae bacterium]
MSNIKNITITKEANIYYGGKVTSRTIILEDGSTQSLGIMLPGEYTFGTQLAEIMEMMSGDLEIRLPNEQWKTLNTPETFKVPANSSFDLKIKTVTDYCCSYIQ